jgi:hypothetical protein
MKLIQPRIIILSLRIILVGMVVLVGVGISMDIRSEKVQDKDDALLMVDQRLSSLFFEINNFPGGPGKDVVFLSHLVSLKKYVSTSSLDTSAYDAVLRDLDTYRKQSEAYAGLEYISFSDTENRCIQEKLNENLDDCYKLEQFQNIAKQLNNGAVYISKLQRISKNEKYISGLYYVTPVFDDFGKNQGMIVLTVDADYFLEDIRNYSKPDEMVYLIDNKGFYLAHPDRNKEFIVGRNNMGTFINDYPETSERILSSKERRIEDADHVFSLRPIHPSISSFEAYEGEQAKSGDESYWILVSVYDKKLVPTGIFAILSEDLFAGHVTMFILVLILAMMGIWGTKYLVSKKSQGSNTQT